MWGLSSWLSSHNGDIAPVTDQKPQYTLATAADLKWAAFNYSCVETQTVYIFAKSGHVAMLQLIYSNVKVIHTTCQFLTKVFYPKNEDGSDSSRSPHWHSQLLSGHAFSDRRTDFRSDYDFTTRSYNCSVSLVDEKTIKIVSKVHEDGTVVDVTITNPAPGFKVGQNGTTIYGDPANEGGRVKHVFWPRALASGTITTPADGELDMSGRAVFIHALQGMLPNNAAASWNFLSVQSPTYSAIVMEHTTPDYYGSKTITVGGIVSDDSVVFAGGLPAVKHLATKLDSETDWDAPEEIECVWDGTNKAGQKVVAGLLGPLGPLKSRIDVFDELPEFARSILAAVLGTKPYVYQYFNKLPISVTVDTETTTEEADAYFEASFISRTEPENGASGAKGSEATLSDRNKNS